MDDTALIPSDDDRTQAAAAPDRDDRAALTTPEPASDAARLELTAFSDPVDGRQSHDASSVALESPIVESEVFETLPVESAQVESAAVPELGFLPPPVPPAPVMRRSPWKRIANEVVAGVQTLFSAAVYATLI